MKKNWWLILIITAGLILTFPYVFSTRDRSAFDGKSKTGLVEINGNLYNVEIARTESEHKKGLSKRDKLDSDKGMLFVFNKPGIYTFWMKDTLIPLDIIWLAPSGVEGINKVVELTTLQLQNNDDIPSYTPKNEADFVLELNANSGVKVGDEVKINY